MSDYGWETVPPDQHGHARGIAVPTSPSKFLKMRTTSFAGSWPEYQLFQQLGIVSEDPTATNSSNDEDPVELEILQNVGNLSNHIVASTASKALTTLKGNNADPFKRLELYLDTVVLLDMYRFRLNVRRFVHDLFDKVIFVPDTLDSYQPAPARRALLMRSSGIISTDPQSSSTAGKSNEQKAEYLVPRTVQIGFVVPPKNS